MTRTSCVGSVTLRVTLSTWLIVVMVREGMKDKMGNPNIDFDKEEFMKQVMQSSRIVSMEEHIESIKRNKVKDDA